MLSKKPLFRLNIRRRVLLGMLLSVLAVGLIGTFSYHSLAQIERKMGFVEVIDDLGNTILEIRRYEKNFMLYGQQEDYDASREYTAKASDILVKLEGNAAEFGLSQEHASLKSVLAEYEALSERLHAERGKGQGAPQAERERLRDTGKQLVDLSLRLVTHERARILNIVQSLKRQLLLSVVVFLALGGGFLSVLGHKTIIALRSIEQATREIAKGRFTALVPAGSDDEVSRVVDAFNHMIAELTKRQDQLVREKKLSSIGVLTSGVAHQLNNPLNNISTSCQILLEEGAEADPAFSPQAFGQHRRRGRPGAGHRQGPARVLAGQGVRAQAHAALRGGGALRAPGLQPGARRGGDHPPDSPGPRAAHGRPAHAGGLPEPAHQRPAGPGRPRWPHLHHRRARR